MNLIETAAFLAKAKAKDPRNPVTITMQQAQAGVRDYVLEDWHECLADLSLGDAVAALQYCYRAPMMLPLQTGHILEAHRDLTTARRASRELAHQVRQGITAPDGVTTSQHREFMAAALDAVEHALTQGATHEQAREHGDAQGRRAIGFTEPPAIEAAPAELDRIKAYVRSLITPQG